MKTIEQMREAIGELMKRLGEIDAKCVQENREYTDEERKEIRRIQARIKDLDEQITLMEETKKLTLDADKSIKEPTKPDPNASPDNRGGGGRDTRASSGDSFRSLSEQLACIVAAGMDKPRVDPRLIQTRATGLSEGIASEGGFLLQDNFSLELLQTIWDEPEVLGRIHKITLTKGNNLKVPRVNETSRADGSRFGGVAGYWTAEGGDKDKSKPDFGQLELSCNKLTALVYLTDELLEDVGAMEGHVRAMVKSEFRFKLLDALINGTGAGMPLGILNSGCLVTVNKETGQTAATIQAENIINMYSRMIASSRKNAVWHINQDIEPQLFTMGLTIGTAGSPIYMPAGGLSASPYGSLLGRPIIPLEQCKTLGAKGDMFFADWSQYWAVDRGEPQSAISIHVKFVQDESVLRFVYRFDGQPWLASAITPHSGSTNTLSHFITLQART